jgi:hypothetical protein
VLEEKLTLRCMVPTCLLLFPNNFCLAYIYSIVVFNLAIISLCIARFLDLSEEMLFEIDANQCETVNNI